jgi:hypothetical protein
MALVKGAGQMPMQLAAVCSGAGWEARFGNERRALLFWGITADARFYGFVLGTDGDAVPAENVAGFSGYRPISAAVKSVPF